MCTPSRWAVCVVAVCVLATTPGCVMRYFFKHRLHPYTSETTTLQDTVYTAEVVAAVAIAVGTLGLLAPTERDWTLWNDLELDFDGDDDEDEECDGSSGRQRVNPNNRPPPRVGRPIGSRRTR